MLTIVAHKKFILGGEVIDECQTPHDYQDQDLKGESNGGVPKNLSPR